MLYQSKRRKSHPHQIPRIAMGLSPALDRASVEEIFQMIEEIGYCMR